MIFPHELLLQDGGLRVLSHSVRAAKYQKALQRNNTAPDCLEDERVNDVNLLQRLETHTDDSSVLLDWRRRSASSQRRNAQTFT